MGHGVVDDYAQYRAYECPDSGAFKPFGKVTLCVLRSPCRTTKRTNSN
ncbi:MAG: hypothetical protein AB7G06_03060 [Bdellovibrionales bacterium]